jgi:hypothetical protein
MVKKAMNPEDTFKWNMDMILDGRLKNGHCRFDSLRLYARRSKRLHPLVGLIDAIDIATIESSRPGRGDGKAFFDWIEMQAHQRGLAVFVECVLNPRFMDFLLRREYVRLTHDQSSVIKIP